MRKAAASSGGTTVPAEGNSVWVGACKDPSDYFAQAPRCSKQLGCPLCNVLGQRGQPYGRPGIVIVMPASTVSTCPVTQRASSQARKTDAHATSHAFPSSLMRPA